MIQKTVKRLIICLAVLSVMVMNVGAVKPVQTKALSAFLRLDEYSVTNDKIVPGQEFTLTLKVTNTSTTETVNDVVVDVYNPNGVSPVYGSVSQAYIGDMAPGEQKEISLNYESFTSITSDTLDFTVYIYNTLVSNKVTLRIPVGSDDPFSIVSSYLPSKVTQWEATSASVNFKVLGDANVSNVSLIIKEGDFEIASSSIGIMTPGASKTQNLSFAIGIAGDHVLDMVLTYTDELGQSEEMKVAKAVMTVVEKIEDNQETQVSDGSQEDDEIDYTRNIAILGAAGMFILIVFLAVVIVVRKRR